MLNSTLLTGDIFRTAANSFESSELSKLITKTKNHGILYSHSVLLPAADVLQFLLSLSILRFWKMKPKLITTNFFLISVAQVHCG